MALALRSCAARNDDSTISFLVVATDQLCEKISGVLLQSSKERKCRTVVHQCESITEVVRLKPELSVDFVVFAFDWRVRNSISEIEANINLIDEHYIISGRACLVNCAGIPKPLNLVFAQARRICRKFNLSLMTRNIQETDRIRALGDALLILAEARLGTRVGIPMLPRPLKLSNS